VAQSASKVPQVHATFEAIWPASSESLGPCNGRNGLAARRSRDAFRVRGPETRPTPPSAMIDAIGALRIYAQGIRRLSDAASTSLFIPSRGAGLLHAILLHEGEAPWPPELASLDAAAAFDARTHLFGQSPEALQSELREAVLIPLPAAKPAWAPALLHGKVPLERGHCRTDGGRIASHNPPSSTGRAGSGCVFPSITCPLSRGGSLFRACLSSFRAERVRCGDGVCS